MNEIRNELLLLLNVELEENEKEKQFRLEWLLDTFENDIKSQLKDLRNKQKDLESNLETLEYVRQHLNIKEK